MRKPSPDKLKQYDLKSQMLQHSAAVVDFFKEQGFEKQLFLDMDIINGFKIN